MPILMSRNAIVHIIWKKTMKATLFYIVVLLTTIASFNLGKYKLFGDLSNMRKFWYLLDPQMLTWLSKLIHVGL